MKKTLLFIAVSIVAVLASCGGSDGDEDSSDELKFVIVKVISDDITAPDGHVFLFNADNSIATGEPNVSLREKYDYPYYLDKGKYVFPISGYGSSYDGELLKNSSYSSHAFYWSSLSSLYGTPKAGGKYTIVVMLENGTYGQAYNTMTITKNCVVTVCVSSSKVKSQFVYATWSVNDYRPGID